VGEVRNREPTAQRQSELQEHLGLLRSALTQTRSSPLVSSARAQIEALQRQIKDLQDPGFDPGIWVDSALRRLDQLREILVALRREAAVGGRAHG
jgi:hypothetical protein